MDENTFPEDDAINYFKTSILAEETNNFNTIFLGCPKPTHTSLWVLFGIFLGIYFILSIFLSNILLVPMTVEGASMYPTLNAEYTTTGNKYATDVVYLWKTQNVNKLDVIVFEASSYVGSPDTIYYIKRVVATSGDSIQFKRITEIDGTFAYSVYLNGNQLNEDYINGQMQYKNESIIPQFILNEEIIVIPDGYIFVMGDNRNNSRDSREIGLVATSTIVGRVVFHIPYGQTLIHGFIKSVQENYIF